ncbi:MAG: hypothetical protein ABWY25_11220 [Paenisporosarcina sp.]
MKLTSVELHPANSSETAILSFRDPGRQNSYNVKAIVGLDADDIVARYYGGSGNSKFYELSLVRRTIVVRIALNPKSNENESYSSLRDGIYKLIASSRTGQLQIQFKRNNSIIAAISGFVTKLESPHFNKEQEIQITVVCDEPMLKAPVRTVISVSSLNTFLVNLQDGSSTAPHGFIFDLKFLADTASLTMADPNDDSWSFVITPSGGFLLDDVLHFSSEYNNKNLYLTRAAVDYHLAETITPGSIWPILFPGNNIFAFSTPENVEWTKFEYYATYWGV